MLIRYVQKLLADRRSYRQQRRVPRCKLAEVVAGAEVRVAGIARPYGVALEAPLSRRICVCYAIVVHDWRVDRSLKTVRVEQQRMPFLLEDGGASAVVDPRAAQMSALFDYQARWVPGQDRSILARVGVQDRDWSYTRVVELEEAIIELDERIAVIGIAERETGVPAGYRDDASPTRLRIYPTTITDDPRLC